MISFPTEIHFGIDILKELPDIATPFGEKALLVTSRKQFREMNIIDELVKKLNDKNISVMLYDDVDENADSRVVDVIGNISRSSRCDYVIGLGGDIVLNTAKAVALICANPGECSDYLTEQDGYRLNISNRPLPTIIIPSMFGSLCEVTPGFIIKDSDDGLRKKLYNSIVTPTSTIIDPNLTKILPRKLLAASGLMLLAYAIELNVSTASTIISDTFALRAIDLVNSYIAVMLKDPDNMEARLNLMMASLFVSLGTASGKLGSIYSLSESITSVNNRIYKGSIAAMMLPQFMEFNLTTSSGKYVQIARLMGENVHKISVLEAAIKAVEKVRVLVEECQIPNKLSELGFDLKDTDEVCQVFSRFEEVKHLPRPVTKDDLKTILEQSF